MSEPNGKWIASALQFANHIENMDRNAKREALGLEAQLRGVTVSTLRRDILGARYCASYAKSVGMHVTNIVAAAITIELLTLLEKRDRIEAHNIRYDVFNGSISSRQLRSRLNSLEMKKVVTRPPQMWDRFVGCLLREFYHEDFCFGKGDSSELAHTLKIDIEAWRPSEKGSLHAIFLSPSDSFSECRGMSIRDQIPLIFAATLFYVEVKVAVHYEEELTEIYSFLERTSRQVSLVAKLVTSA